MEPVHARHLHLVAVLVVRLEEEGTQGGRERQGVQCGDEDRDGHRHTELTVERAGHAADERHGDEHRCHDQRDGDDGTRYLVHGVDRCGERRLVALVELGVDSLYHHDGVVDHDGDGQQQCRQCEQVDGESEHLEEEERTDERHRHGDERDERGAPVLQEEVDDDEHQQQGEHQSEDHLLDRGIEELGHVVVDLVEHARRKQLGLLLELGLHLLGYVVGVGAGNLLHHAHDRRDVVVLHRHRVLLSAQLYACHVFQLQRGAVGTALHDDVAKLLGRLQSSGIAHGVLVGHVRLLSEGAGCGLDVLLGQQSADVGRHQAVLLHHVGLQPDAHGVGLQAGALHVAHALYALDGRHHVDVVVVGEELVVVASVRRQGEHDDLRRLALHHGHADARHLGGQQCLCLRDAVLHVDGTHVGVETLTEQDADLCRAGRSRRGHVVHALHTVDALLERCQHGVLHRLGIGTGIAGVDHHRGRCNVWVLLYRQRHQAYEAQQHDGDGDHRRQYWTLDKCCESHIVLFWNKGVWE